MKVDLPGSGTLDVAPPDVESLTRMIGPQDQRRLCAAVRGSYKRVASVLDRRAPDPLLDDVDAWLATLLLREKAAGVDLALLEQLLGGWESAEASLSRAARLALRAAARLVQTVLAAPDKTAFDAAVPSLTGHLDDEAATLCSEYVRVVRDDRAPARSSSQRRHYLSRRLDRVRELYVRPAVADKGRAWVVRRLTAAMASTAPGE